MSCEAVGVYCGLCVLFRQLEVENSVNVLTALRALRKQRPGILTSKVTDYTQLHNTHTHTQEQLTLP